MCAQEGLHPVLEPDHQKYWTSIRVLEKNIRKY
jgi:hypothetical protein